VALLGFLFLLLFPFGLLLPAFLALLLPSVLFLDLPLPSPILLFLLFHFLLVGAAEFLQPQLVLDCLLHLPLLLQLHFLLQLELLLQQR
jgi:hypothetical protein